LSQCDIKLTRQKQVVKMFTETPRKGEKNRIR